MHFHRLTVDLMNCEAGCLSKWGIRNNVHPYWRFWWNRQSGCSICYNGNAFSLDSDHIVAVAPNSVIDRYQDQPVDHFYLHATLRYPFDNVRPQVLTARLSGEQKSDMENLWRRVAELGRGQPCSRRVCAQLHHLVLTIIAQIKEKDWQFLVQDQRILNVLRTIEQQLTRPWSNKALAAIACLSPSAFAHLFRKLVGESPQAYLLRRRLELACSMLHHTNESIAMVAVQCGFCNRNYFSRMFSRRYGMGPAAYRDQRVVISDERVLST